MEQPNDTPENCNEPTKIEEVGAESEIKQPSVILAPPSLNTLLRNLGGHENFHQYQTWFRSLYCNPKKPITDVMKRHVLFGNYPDLDDCAHVCYGSKEGQAYNPDHWDPIRAERIGWIYHALTKPNAICPDSKVGRHEKYLLFVPKDDVITFDQHYVVITRLMEKRKVAFITAYHITSTQYDTAKNVRPHIYPVEPPRRKRGK